MNMSVHIIIISFFGISGFEHEYLQWFNPYYLTCYRSPVTILKII